jgi:ankyrin repeat protein
MSESSAVGDIWRAASTGDVSEIERLVGQDPSLLNAGDAPRRKTPLMWASDEGHVAAVRWLLDRGAAVNARDEYGQTALRFPSSNGHAPVVSLLLERGADPTIADNAGWPPLFFAILRKRLEIVRRLLEHPSVSASINHRDQQGRTAVFEACAGGDKHTVKLLLERGADPSIANYDGISPVAYARAVPNDRSLYPGRLECVALVEVRCSLSL